MFDVRASGTVAGVIYGVSTAGNIIGTLGTTLLVVPNIGSRSTTYILAAVTLLCAVMLELFGRITHAAVED